MLEWNFIPFFLLVKMTDFEKASNKLVTFANKARIESHIVNVDDCVLHLFEDELHVYRRGFASCFVARMNRSRNKVNEKMTIYSPQK